MTTERAVISGIGVVSPLGIGVESLREALREGRSGIKPIDRFDTTPYPSRLGGCVEGFEPRDFIPAMRVRRMDRACQMAVAAGGMALADGKLSLDDIDPSDLGIVIGTGGAGTESTYRFFQGLVESGPQGTNPMLFPTTVTNAPAGMLGIEIGAAGPNTTFAQRGNAAEAAIICASRWICQGRARYVLAGGVDELNEAYFHGHSVFGILSPGGAGGEEGMRPFDASRNGIVMTEGSTILLLEAASGARERSAPIYGTLAGWGEASDAADLLAYPRSDAAVERALSAALRSAGIGPDKIGWLNASANSSLRLDPLEVSAISRVFAARAGGVPTSSVKSYFGDSMATGALRAAVSLLALRDGVIPPTLNLREPIEAVGVDHVRGAPREVNGIEAVLQDGVADGGDCLAMVFTKD